MGLTAAKETQEAFIQTDSGNLRREPPANQEKENSCFVIDPALFPPTGQMDQRKIADTIFGYSKRVGSCAWQHTIVKIVIFFFCISQVVLYVYTD